MKENINSSNMFGSTSKNYERSTSSDGSVLYKFNGIIPDKNINPSIKAMSSRIDHSYSNSGFITSIEFQSPSRESLVSSALSLLCRDTETYFLDEFDSFEFKIVS